MRHIIQGKKKHLWAANNFLGSMHRAVRLLRALGGEVCSHLGPGRAAGRTLWSVWPRPWMLTGMAMLEWKQGQWPFSLVRQARPCQPAKRSAPEQGCTAGWGGEGALCITHTVSLFVTTTRQAAGSGSSAQMSQHFLKPVFSAGIILPQPCFPSSLDLNASTCSGFLEATPSPRNGRVPSEQR